MRLRYLLSLWIIVSLAMITSCKFDESSSSDSSDNAITAFSFEAANNSALSTDVTGTIDQDNNTIAVSVPSSTTVTALVATFTTSGTSVTVDGTEQSSGTTANDFSDSVTYTVTAEDDTTLDYVVSTTKVITQQAYIKAVNNGSIDKFSNHVSLYGDTLAVSATGEDSDQTTITNDTTAGGTDDGSHDESGAVYVYQRSGAAWSQQAYIKAVNNDSDDYFGNSISLSGDTLAVGAYYEFSNQATITNGTTASSNNSNSYSGAVYVYQRSGTNWSQQAYIKAVNNDSDDNFGISVSLSGDTLAVGAYQEDSDQTTITNGTTAGGTDSADYNSGAVYVYQRNGTDWSQQAYIKAVNNGSDDMFGSSVSLSGDTLAVGACLEDSNQTTITNGITVSSNDTSINSGAVYVYQRSGTDWSQQAYIKAANNGSNDFFGNSLSLSGDTLAVGAYLEDSNQATITNGTTASSDDDSSESGAVYVYQRSGTDWSQQAYIKAVNNGVDDKFGISVSLSGDTLAVGSYQESSNQTTITNGTTASSDDDSSNSGAVYLYQRNGTDWSQQAYIKTVNNGVDDRFGFVSLSGDTLAVGAYLEDSNQTTITNGTTAGGTDDGSHDDSGAVYIYH